MKKVIVIFTFICILLLGAFAINGVTEKAQTSEWLIANNANGVFDSTVVQGSNTYLDMPESCPALPFEDLSELSSLNFIENIYPYYPLFIFDEIDGKKSTFIYWQDEEEQKKMRQMPILIEYGDHREKFVLKLVTDEDKFNDILRQSGTDSFLKKFDCQSGIYISEVLYQRLDIDEDASQLTIQVPVQVPVIAQMVNPSVDDEASYVLKSDEYTAVKYASVNVEMKVAGVIRAKSSIDFCQGLEIVIPYDLGKEIYESADRTSLQPEVNQMLWEPNAYVIKCSEEITMDELGQQILSEIGQVYISQYGYENTSSLLTKLYPQAADSE